MGNLPNLNRMLLAYDGSCSAVILPKQEPLLHPPLHFKSKVGMQACMQHASNVNVSADPAYTVTSCASISIKQRLQASANVQSNSSEGMIKLVAAL